VQGGITKMITNWTLISKGSQFAEENKPQTQITMRQVECDKKDFKKAMVIQGSKKYQQCKHPLKCK
jgi:hypothetical protein